MTTTTKEKIEAPTEEVAMNQNPDPAQDTFAPPDTGAPIDLTQWDEPFADAPMEERGTFAPIPPGKYQVIIEHVELGASSQNIPMFKKTFRILGPTCVGRKLWHNNMIGSAENLKWLKTDLHTMGVDLEKVSDLQRSETFEKFINIGLEVTVKNQTGANALDASGNPRYNVFINQKIALDPSVVGAASGMSAADMAAAENVF